MPRPDVRHDGAQPARLAQQFRHCRRVRRSIAAQIPAPSTELRPRTDYTLVVILKQLVSSRLAIGFLYRPVKRVRGFFRVAVTLAGADEGHPVARPVSSFYGQP